MHEPVLCFQDGEGAVGPDCGHHFACVRAASFPGVESAELFFGHLAVWPEYERENEFCMNTVVGYMN